MTRWGEHWTEEQYDAYIQKFKGAGNSPVQPTDPQSNSEHEVSRPPESKKVHSRYHIRIHQIRRRSIDTDGAYIKSAIDGLVRGGVLPDDTSEWVESVEVTQEKHRGSEATIIEIWEVE